MSDQTTIKRQVNSFPFVKGQSSGMHSDQPISMQPDGTYRNAWGVSNQSRDESVGAGIYSSHGQEMCVVLPEGYDIRAHHFLEERDEHIVFLSNGGASEIGYWNNQSCEYTKIIDDSDIDGCDLNFGQDEWIPIVSKNIRNGTCEEIHIYWSREATYYRLNIDRPCAPIPCDELKLFNCKCLPTPTAYTTEKGGHDLEAGAYQYFAQLEDEDGNTTNWFSVSNPVYIGSENNKAGDLSEQAIHITVTNLSEDYPKVNLGVIKTIGGAKTALAIAQLNYSENGVSFFHRSQGQHLYDLTIEEILTKNPGYIRGKDLFQHDRRLYLYNTIGERNLNIQKRIIDNVTAKYKVGRVPMKYAHQFRGLQHDGIYSFSVWYNFCDGRKSRAFHIPGTGVEPMGGDSCIDCEDRNMFNGSTPTSVNGSPYNNTITKDPDEYDPFVPQDQGLLSNDDFETVDTRQFLPEEGGDGGNECACWAATIALARNPNPPFATNRQGLYADYLYLKDICESGCVDGGDGVDGDPEAEERTFPNGGDASGCNCFDSEDISSLRTIIIGNGAVPEEFVDDERVIEYWTGMGMTYESEGCGDCEEPAPPQNSNPDDRFKTQHDVVYGDDEKDPAPKVDHDNTYEEKHNNSGSTREGRTTGGPDGGKVDINDCEPTIIYADTDCCVVKEIIPCIEEEGQLSVYESCELYPDHELCCVEEKTYGHLAGQPIRHHRMPSIAQQPHFISYHDGVPSTEFKGNHEYNNSFARFIWVEFDNIPIPTDDELDIPLCSENPFTIGYQLRDGHNKNVVASGMLFGTFNGETLGEDMLFPNVGVNSGIHIDRWVSQGRSSEGEHLGTSSTIPAYVFHSPDTAFDRPALDATYMDNVLSVDGIGWRHGLYAEGEDPPSNYVGVCHRKGSRSSVNLNKWITNGNDIKCVKAASYVPANSVLDKSDEFSQSLANLNRESCVYIETDGSSVSETDESFSLDTRTPQRALAGKANYVSLNRYIPNAYGSVVNSVYHPLWNGSSTDITENRATVLVRDGDTFINYWSIKRTSYVSDHVPGQIIPRYEFFAGISLPIQFIKSLLSKLFHSISPNCQCGTIPKAGNTDDPRVVVGSDGDIFFPQVQTTLVSFPVESSVNLGYQGSGDSPETSTYRDLNGQAFDSSYDGGTYANAWMDRFYATMCENPKWKCIARVIANILFTYGIGLFLLITGIIQLGDGLGNVEVGVSNRIMALVQAGFGVLLIASGAAWIIAWANTDIDNKMIDNLLGVKDCFPDKRPGGGIHHRMRDDRVQGFEDNYYEYNYDYSETNRIEAVLGLPNPYDPCHCPLDRTYEILFSNQQDPTSSRDAYRNFKTNDYFNIPNHYGSLMKMFQLGNNVYVQTTDAMFQIGQGNLELKTDGGNVYLESGGDALRHPQMLFGGVPEGKGGTTDPNANVVTKWGYINFDHESREVALFTGNDYIVLGEFGMGKFLDNYIPFEADLDNVIRDEKALGGVGYSVGVDNANSHVFITKIDQRADGTNRSWTMSFDMRTQSWVSNEYFTPRIYMWDRWKMFSWNSPSFSVWEHNVRGKWLSTYGSPVPMVVDFVVKDKETLDAFKWRNTTMDTEFDRWVDGGYVPMNDEFWEQIGAQNSFQSSGMMPTVDMRSLNTMEQVSEDRSILPVSYLHRKRRFNSLVQSVPTNSGKRSMTTWGEDYFLQFLPEAPSPITHNIGDEYGDDFVDNYMLMRVYYMGKDNVRVFFKNVLTETQNEIW